MGKRIVLELEGELFLVIHLMIAGRLRWLSPAPRPPGRIALAAFDFADGTLAVHRGRHEAAGVAAPRAGRGGARAFDAGGLEVLRGRARRVRAAAQRRENHTLKRALTDPRLFSGIGNAYSDEILHRARLSPVALTSTLADDGGRAALRRDARDARRLDRAAARRGRRRSFPRR